MGQSVDLVKFGKFGKFVEGSVEYAGIPSAKGNRHAPPSLSRTAGPSRHGLSWADLTEGTAPEQVRGPIACPQRRASDFLPLSAPPPFLAGQESLRPAVLR